MSLRAWLARALVVAATGWIAYPALAEDIHPGQHVAERADCAVCHVVPGVADPGRLASCVGCHAWVKSVAANPAARAKAMAYFPNWPRYEHTVQSYAAVPDLEAAFARLDAEWLRRYLADPHDLRPNMPETMVRLGLDPEAITLVADWAATFAQPAVAGPPPSTSNLEAGRVLFEQYACSSCHNFGELYTSATVAAAPDLRWARERMSDDRIAAWIENPQGVSARATMPRMGLTAAQAALVRDFVVLANPGGRPPVAFTSTVPATGALDSDNVLAPTWSTVEARVFGRICVHCHMDPTQNEGRAGPGNAGGFGWAATGIELQTYESVVANREGILAAIRRRQREEARDHVAPGEVPVELVRPELPGMPLGLPALPAADIRLVEAWYAAGAPR
jgi:cytochrome c2